MDAIMIDSVCFEQFRLTKQMQDMNRKGVLQTLYAHEIDFGSIGIILVLRFTGQSVTGWILLKHVGGQQNLMSFLISLQNFKAEQMDLQNYSQFISDDKFVENVDPMLPVSNYPTGITEACSVDSFINHLEHSEQISTSGFKDFPTKVYTVGLSTCPFLHDHEGKHLMACLSLQNKKDKFRHSEKEVFEKRIWRNEYADGSEEQSKEDKQHKRAKRKQNSLKKVMTAYFFLISILLLPAPQVEAATLTRQYPILHSANCVPLDTCFKNEGREEDWVKYCFPNTCEDGFHYECAESMENHVTMQFCAPDQECKKGTRKVALYDKSSKSVTLHLEPCPDGFYQDSSTQNSSCLKACSTMHPLPKKHVIVHRKANGTSPGLGYCNYTGGFFNLENVTFFSLGFQQFCVSRKEHSPKCNEDMNVLPNGSCSASCPYGYDRDPDDGFKCSNNINSDNISMQPENRSITGTISATAENTTKSIKNDTAAVFETTRAIGTKDDGPSKDVTKNDQTDFPEWFIPLMVVKALVVFMILGIVICIVIKQGRSQGMMERHSPMDSPEISENGDTTGLMNPGRVQNVNQVTTKKKTIKCENYIKGKYIIVKKTGSKDDSDSDLETDEHQDPKQHNPPTDERNAAVTDSMTHDNPAIRMNELKVNNEDTVEDSGRETWDMDETPVKIVQGQ